VREGNTRGLFKNVVVFNLLAGEPEYLDPLKDETPEGWWVTGYPWSAINTPEHKAFLEAYQKRWKDYPRQGSVVGYAAIHTVANAVRKAKAVEAEKLVEALKGLEMRTPFGPVSWRAIDHQSTMGAFVGQLAKKDGRGTMVNWRYADGAEYQPSDQEILKLRKE
jgi:branched-chain amino acid transport system substrate-binding protein